MAIFDLQFFDLSQISTDDPDGFSDNGGYQFEWGVNTVTIAPGATAQTVSIEDTTDTFFDDDAGTAQTLNGPATLNGTTYPDNTIIEAEYRIIVEDSLGNPYELQFVSANNDAYNIVGFVVQGAVPPFGEALTITSSSDFPSGTYAYSTSSPACFGPKTRIATARGHVQARRLEVGDRLILADGTTARIQLLLESTTDVTKRDHLPIRVTRNALGSGLPKRDLILSPQHRVWMGDAQALVPARALLCLPGIEEARDHAGVALIHVVLNTHDIVLAEGVPCESFWPGPIAMSALPVAAQLHVQRIMSGARPAAPMPSVRDAMRALKQARQRHLPKAA